MNKKVKITLAISFLIVFVLSTFLFYRQVAIPPELGEDIWTRVTVSSYEQRGVSCTIYTFEVDTNRKLKIVRGKENVNSTKPWNDWLIDKQTRIVSLTKSQYETLQLLAKKVYDYPLKSSIPNIDPPPDRGWEIHGEIYDRSWVGCLFSEKSYSDFGNNELFLDFVKELAKYGRGKIKNINKYIP